MRESTQTMSKLFSVVFDTISAMDDREIDLLIRGKATLHIVEKSRAKKSASLDNFHPNDAISETVRKLNAAESREVAADLLASIDQPRKKDFLILLAKSCGVRVESRDSIARIEQKLVENVVGVRLDSEAIRKVAF